MRFEGRLAFVDLGSGAWVLETDDGARMPLYGEIPPRLEGRRVVIDGTRVEEMGFAMTGGGAGIEVQRIQAA